MELVQNKLLEILCIDESATNSELILRKFLSVVNETSTTEIFLEKLFRCQGNTDRINVVKKHFHWQPLDPELQQKFQKDSQISKELTKIGDEFFNEKNFLPARIAYNLSKLYSPPGPEFLVAIQKCRSTCSSVTLESPIHCNCTQESPNDAHILSFNSSECAPSRIKGQENSDGGMSEIQRREQFCKNLFSLTLSHESVPAVHANVEIRVDPARGRGLYANSDIPIGTTLLVETPFVAGLAKALEWDVEHCHQCFRQISCCTPCLDCVFTVYCSATCRDSAKVYHQYECLCLPQLCLALKDEILSNFHIVFKLICLLGPEHLHDLFIRRTFNVDSTDILPTEFPDSNSYESIRTLMSKIYPKEGYYFVLMSLILTKTLKENSKFFDSTKHSEEFEDYISGFILYNFETLRKNTFGFSEVPLKDRIQLVGILKGSEDKFDCNMKPFAAGILPCASLFNHSCDPNVIRVTGLQSCTTTFVALKTLRKDEELRISYGPMYGSIFNDRNTRQKDLIYGYDFKCDCIACKNEWQGILPLKHKSTKEFFCPNCSKQFSHEIKFTKEFLQCKLTKDFQCKNCKEKFPQESFLMEVKKSEMAIDISKRLVLTNKPLPCVSSLESALTVLGDVVKPPNSNILIGQILLEDAYNLICCLSEMPGLFSNK